MTRRVAVHFWPVLPVAAATMALGRRVEVGVGQHDCGVVAAEAPSAASRCGTTTLADLRARPPPIR